MPRRSAAVPVLDTIEGRPALACLKYAATTVAGVAAAIAMCHVLVTDVRVERLLDQRGVTTQATFVDTYCGKCSTLPIAFHTADGRLVRADLPVSGEPDDGTVLVRYDPLRPSRVHPANGVVYDEVFSGFLGVAALAWAVRAAWLLRSAVRLARNSRRRQRSRAPSGPVQVSHVKLLQP